MWLLYLVLFFGGYVLIAMILKWTVIYFGRRSERSSVKREEPRAQERTKSTTIPSSKGTPEKIIEVEKTQSATSDKKPSESDLILEEIKKTSNRRRLKEGEKYYTPEDTEQESQITKEVEAFNREVKVQNSSYRKNKTDN